MTRHRLSLSASLISAITGEVGFVEVNTLNAAVVAAALALGDAGGKLVDKRPDKISDEYFFSTNATWKERGLSPSGNTLTHLLPTKDGTRISTESKH